MTKKKFKGFDYENGKIVKVAYFNGYAFGDKLLEGVMFKAEIVADGTMNVSLTKDAEVYFKTAKLSQKQWLKEAYEYAEHNDIFSENENGTGADLCLLIDDEHA
jgi:hypothetical protein